MAIRRMCVHKLVLFLVCWPTAEDGSSASGLKNETKPAERPVADFYIKKKLMSDFSRSRHWRNMMRWMGLKSRRRKKRNWRRKRKRTYKL